MRLLIGCAVVLAAMLLPAAPSAGDQGPRLPVPHVADQWAARKLAKEAFGERAKEAQKDPDKCERLVRDMFRTARTSNAVHRFVLLGCARKLAAGAGLARLAFEASDLRQRDYDLDVLQEKLDALKIASKAARSTTHREAVAELAYNLREEAVERDDFDRAKLMGEIALSAARAARNGELVKKVVARNKDVETLAEEYAKVWELLEVLQDDPLDPRANLAVGRYYCFIRNHWDWGLILMALGPPDHELTEMAIRDLRRPQAAEEQAELGDAWHALAQSLEPEGVAHRSVTLRACQWYRQAEPNLTGLPRARIQHLMTTIDRQYPAEASSSTGNYRRSNGPTGAGTMNERQAGRAPMTRSKGPPCRACHGKGTKKCPNSACSRGTMWGYPRDQVVARGPDGRLLGWRVPIRVRCPVCGGTGYVGVCPRCGGTGVEPNDR
jgi:hypothetical protein